jgi:CO/xanthine dehydrogenase FAD-binding subunit
VSIAAGRWKREARSATLMRSYVPAYDLRVPHTLDEALDMLGSEPGRWRPFAGGTDLMVQLEAGRLDHREYVSLWHLSELRFVEVTTDRIVLGATTTYADVQRHPVIAGEFPLLCRAAAETGGVANQNRGTLGGNIANASPAADTPPALLAYDAELELISRRGRRRVGYDRFHTGYKQMDLAPDELILAIRLPRDQRRTHHFYRKVGTRRAQAISKVSLAGVAILVDGTLVDVRLALGSVAPTVVRAREAEQAIRGRRIDDEAIAAARAALARDIAPIDDIRSTARYRAAVAGNLLVEFLSLTS